MNIYAHIHTHPIGIEELRTLFSLKYKFQKGKVLVFFIYFHIPSAQKTHEE